MKSHKGNSRTAFAWNSYCCWWAGQAKSFSRELSVCHSPWWAMGMPWLILSARPQGVTAQWEGGWARSNFSAQELWEPWGGAPHLDWGLEEASRGGKCWLLPRWRSVGHSRRGGLGTCAKEWFRNLQIFYPNLHWLRYFWRVYFLTAHKLVHTMISK